MIKNLHDKLLNKQISSVELTENYFKSIEEKNKDINAYLTLTKNEALKQANKVDEKIARGENIGILEGIPGSVKDVICMKDVRTTASSRILDNYISPYDATVVKKLKESGAVILGKTNCDEFAMGSSNENSAYGPVKNPNDLERVPGGSSGGSAASVAADMAVWSIGTDTGGSIRQPASFCGAVGLKPTYGRVSRFGLLAMASSLDVVGPITKTVEDAAIILSAISDHDKMDATSVENFGKKYEDYLSGEVRGIRIGIVKEYFESLNESAKKAMESVVEKYKKMGADILEIEIPNAKYALPTYYIIQPCETSSNLARYDGVRYGARIDDGEKSKIEKGEMMSRNLLENYLDTRRYNLGKEVKRRIMLGTYALSSGYYEAYYLRAQKVRTLIKNDFENIFKKVDIVLTPTSPTPAFKLGEKTSDPVEMYLADVFTITANIVGIPAISLPIKEIAEKSGSLPFSFQLMGKWFDEENLLRVAHAYEIY